MAFVDLDHQQVDAISGGSTELTSTLCDRQRAEIIRTGKALADAGAHYLWGAEGQLPTRGGAGGIGYTIDGLSQLASGAVLNARRKPMGRLLKEGELVLPADILLYKGHIAFALGDRPGQTYSLKEKFAILQAESAIYGLNYDKARGGHTHCIRLSDSTLLDNSF